jgi:hypothetical protein
LAGDAKGLSPLRKIGVGGSRILKCVLRKDENFNEVWVFLFQDRDNLPAFCQLRNYFCGTVKYRKFL